jgi:hypothetical protein
VHQEAPDEVPYFHCREFLEKNSRKSVGKPHISKVLDGSRRTVGSSALGAIDSQ